MGCKRGFSKFGRLVARVWLFADELLFNSDVCFRFKGFGMAGEIAVGDTKQFFERSEIGRLIDHQHRHDAEPDPVVKSLVDILDDVFQNYRDWKLIPVNC
jgi:hypothetical protein